VYALLNPVLAGASELFYEYNDQPTVGGDPTFATKSDVMLNAVNSLIQAKDYEAAEKLALEVTVNSPDMIDGWMMLAYTRSLNAKFELSNKAYAKALGYGADAIEVLTRQAYNNRKLKDADKTRKCYDGILEIDPTNVEILIQYANYETSLENYDTAVRHYESVLTVEPDHVDAIDQLSRLEAKLGNNIQQKYWLEKGLAVDGENPKFLKRLSLIFLNEQNYSLSIHYLNKLLVVDPEDAGVHRNKGIAHYQQGEKKKAKESFEMVRMLGGKMDGLYGPLADCYRSTGSQKDALEVIKEGIGLNTQQAWLLSIWGKILEDGQNYDAAINKFSKAVSLKDEPWSGYAKKQIARQAQLKKRAAMIAAQGANQ
jgi:tetratricopeptide (TPR) repeat protein